MARQQAGGLALGPARLPQRRGQAQSSRRPGRGRVQTRTMGRRPQRTRTKPRASSGGGGGAAGRLGGIALVTAAAGLAFRNRDKLLALVKRGKSEEPQPYVASPPAVPPVETPSPVPPGPATGVDAPPRNPPL